MTDSTRRVRLTAKVGLPAGEGGPGDVVELPADYADMLVGNEQAVELTDLNERDAVTPRGPQVPPDPDPDPDPEDEDDEDEDPEDD